jgi:hypothetical protein
MAKTGNNIIVLERYYYNFELPYHVKSLPVLTNLELVTLNAPTFSSLVIVGPPLYIPEAGLPTRLCDGAEVCLFFDIGGYGSCCT